MDKFEEQEMKKIRSIKKKIGMIDELNKLW